MGEQAAKAPEPGHRDVPFGQIVLDNVFLWIALGVALPLLSYITWGLLDIGSTPVEPLAAPSALASPAPAPPGALVVQVTLGDFWIRSAETTFRQDVPYRFVVTNDGQTWHEFMVTPPTAGGMSMSMEEMDQMSLGVLSDVPPGGTMTLDVTFDRSYPSGALELSCRVAGHYESGMRLPVVVG